MVANVAARVLWSVATEGVVLVDLGDGRWGMATGADPDGYVTDLGDGRYGISDDPGDDAGLVLTVSGSRVFLEAP